MGLSGHLGSQLSSATVDKSLWISSMDLIPPEGMLAPRAIPYDL